MAELPSPPKDPKPPPDDASTARSRARRVCAARATKPLHPQSAALCDDARRLAAVAATTGPLESAEVLLLRASNRNAAVCARELESAAQLAGLPLEMLSHYGAGTWILAPCDAETDGGARAARAEFVAMLPQLCGVRRRLQLLAAAATPAELARSASHLPVPFERWTLAYEQLFPTANMALVPWSGVRHAPSLSIALHAALGPAGYSSTLGEDTDEQDAAELVVLEAKGALLLGRALPLVEPAASAAELPHRGAEDVERLPRWISAWETRGFQFSSSLEPLHAIAAINLAVMAHTAAYGTAAERARPFERRRQLWVHDPCCGSGTILAAAMAAGHPCSGSDVSAEFVEQAAGNLAGLGYRPQLFEHDARGPFPPVAHGRWAVDSEPEGPALAHARPDIVVSNPPWGKHFGKTTDGALILDSVARQLAGATMCWIGNAETVEHALSMEGLSLVSLQPLGSVQCAVFLSTPEPNS